jgi:hypothetical protein
MKMKSLILTSMLTAVSLMAAQNSTSPAPAAPAAPKASTTAPAAPAAPQADSKKVVKKHHNKTDSTPKSGATSSVKPATGGTPAASAPVSK